ncbi:MAG: TatD family hydrolase, partial [Candidatus Izemoplasmatales bacterium]
MLFDTHCHLNDDTLFADLDSVIERAKEAEVGNILCVGYDKASSERALQIAEQYDFVFAAIGIHPTNSKEATEEDF